MGMFSKENVCLKITAYFFWRGGGHYEHFDTDPDFWIRFVEKLIRILLRIRPKIEEIPTFFITFFLLITQKIIYYCMNIENFNSNEKNLNNDLFMYLQ